MYAFLKPKRLLEIAVFNPRKLNLMGKHAVSMYAPKDYALLSTETSSTETYRDYFEVCVQWTSRSMLEILGKQRDTACLFAFPDYRTDSCSRLTQICFDHRLIMANNLSSKNHIYPISAFYRLYGI